MMKEADRSGNSWENSYVEIERCCGLPADGLLLYFLGQVTFAWVCLRFISKLELYFRYERVAQWIDLKIAFLS